MIKKGFIVSTLLLALFLLIGCQKNNQVSLDDNIVFPNEPYSLDDHPLIKDQYAFYDISGTQPKYWGSANVHDPVMIKEGDYYYIFSTDAQYGITNEKGIHIRKTKDLINYEYVGTALDLKSVSPAIDYVEYNRDGILVDFFWAPEIYKKIKGDGTVEYWLFYSNSSFGQRTSFMGLAKSDHIEGPYIHDVEILRTHQSVGSPNAIDPALIVEEVNGIEKMFLSYGSWNSGIYIIELNPETGAPMINQTLEKKEVDVNTDVIGKTTKKMKNIPTANDLAFGTKILNIYSAEAPYIIKEKDYYYLFVTTGFDLTYDYNTRVFRANNIYGPYLDSEGNLAISNTNRETFRAYGNMITDAYQFNFDKSLGEQKRGWAGLGHSAAYKDGDTWLYLSHYRGTYIDKDRFFFGVRKMHFVNGWPILEANRHVMGAEELTDKVNISGNYQIHLLDKNVQNAKLNNNIITIVNKAKNITLTLEKYDEKYYNVIGDLTGKWKFENNQLELVLNNKIYRGIITPQWQFEKHKGTLSFSLIDEKGYSLWGNRFL